MPISIDGAAVSGITIDGQSVTEVTIDGTIVFPSSNLSVSSTLAGGSATLTLYEDQTGDGYSDTSQTYSIVDGSNSYDVSNFDLSSGNDVWYDLTVNNATETDTVKINSITLEY